MTSKTAVVEKKRTVILKLESRIGEIEGDILKYLDSLGIYLMRAKSALLLTEENLKEHKHLFDEIEKHIMKLKTLDECRNNVQGDLNARRRR